jgi:hypothetical protein
LIWPWVTGKLTPIMTKIHQYSAGGAGAGVSPDPPTSTYHPIELHVTSHQLEPPSLKPNVKSYQLESTIPVYDIFYSLEPTIFQT